MVLKLNHEQVRRLSLRCVAELDCLAPDDTYPNNLSTGDGTVSVPAAVSAWRVAQLAGANPNDVWELQIEDDPHPPLLGLYVNPDNSTPVGLNPIFYDDGGGVTFRQPPTQASHDNGRYTYHAAAMTVDVVTVNHLDVTATVDRTAAKPGAQLSFTLTVPVSEVRPGENLLATWSYGDRHTKTVAPDPSGTEFSAATSYTYTAPGSYRGVTVTVAGDQGSEGTATLPTITIDSNPPPSGGTHHHQHHPTTHKPPPGGSSHTPTSQPTGGSGPSAGTGSGGTGDVKPTAEPPPAAAQPNTPAPIVTPPATPLPKVPSVPGATISGVLLSAPVTEIARLPARSHNSKGASATGHGGGVPGALGGIGLAVLLLAGGFLSEGLAVVRWRVQ
jgi:hypothetical protein